ncbi:LOW QUALITY PROTEIN: chaperone protein dnaJ C76, chloroplastic-like [Olea europaea var. sylvestris]|uniref:LOW QUALITY PROTEIN: chaperone protein dnaJ C76, chloroplastic-like n=1 Tax=Olea europaea var. sylvestris TaxID=158386 RepID=UPI000C1CF035|nr:LOW QUALITY PROTEIN: chaperone protein dnaJ C76, chloroplastic-like [Olea europaea var. sylvestris]
MHSATLPLYTPSIVTSNPKNKSSKIAWNFSERTNFQTCRVSASSNSPITEFNLYELLGIDSSSDQTQIKLAYRNLQKRCHPDIAGPAGHDMAIILNETYALLSDPNSRRAYDKEQAKVADLQGYTGSPIYSVWYGSESENRAVFVDEVKCIGCLKCALCAEKTFAVESVYGRARVVLSDIFDEVEKFLTKYARHRASTNYSQESEAHTAARVSAVQAIQMISNWLYWQSPGMAAEHTDNHSLVPLSRKHADPSVKRLRDAAAARRQARNFTKPTKGVFASNTSYEEYWIPSKLVLPEVTTVDSDSRVAASYSSPTTETKEPRARKFSSPEEDTDTPLLNGLPVGTAIMAAVFVRLRVGEQVGNIKEHIGGSLVLDIVNSSWLQVLLAGVTWYLIGMALMELVEAIRRK